MMRLREVIDKLNMINDGNRTLLESFVVPEVGQAMNDWIKNSGKGVLIGGMAFSYYHRPRATMDIDLIFLQRSDIPDNVAGFKRTREQAFQHNKTHVEVEVLAADHLDLDPKLVQKVIDTAVEKDGVKVSTPTAVVALKLQRLKNNDIGDIINLTNHYDIDLSDWPVGDDKLAKYQQILEI